MTPAEHIARLRGGENRPIPTPVELIESALALCDDYEALAAAAKAYIETDGWEATKGLIALRALLGEADQ